MASKAGSMVLFALLILPTPQDPTVAVLSSANQEKLWKIGKRYGKDTKRSGLRCLYRLLRPLSISLSLSWWTLCDLWSSKTCQGATRAGFSATPEAALGGSNSSNHEEFPWHPVAFRDMCIMWCWNWDKRRLWWPPLLGEIYFGTWTTAPPVPKHATAQQAAHLPQGAQVSSGLSRRSLITGLMIGNSPATEPVRYSTTIWGYKLIHDPPPAHRDP